MIIRLLSPDFDWDEYIDLTMRSFGPLDEAILRPHIEPVVAAGRCLGAFDGGRLAGAALYHDMRQWWHGRPVKMAGVAGVGVAPEYRLSRSRTDQLSAPADPACPGGQAPLALSARGLAALYAGTPVATLRRAGLADGGSPAADAALDGAFAATPFMLDGF